MKKNYLLLLLMILKIVSSCAHPDANSITAGGSTRSAQLGTTYTPPENIIGSAAVVPKTVSPQPTREEVNIIDMEKKDGVRYVWIEVNGLPLKFIFDTGASSIFISPAEALVLVKQGTLDENDIVGQEKYQDATGGISEGTIINLKEVKIGSRILRNVKASVSDNIESPLLLGQSALEQFGSIEIDNKNDQIILR